MPFIKSKVSCVISEQQEKKLKMRMGKAIELVPGKMEEYLLLEFEDNSRLWLRGSNEEPIAYIEAAIFGNEPHYGYDAFTAEVTKMFNEVLGIAYEAAKLTDQDKADDYLFRLRKATIVETRQTTREDELVRVAAEAGLNETIFREYLSGGAAEAAFRKDLEYSKSLGIRGLPAYLIHTGERELLVQSLIGYDEFIRIFRMLSK